MKVLVLVLMLSGVAHSVCGGAESPNSPPPVALLLAESATYRVTFHTDWTQAVFAIQFSVGRHFSGLVGATHNDRVTFWPEDEGAWSHRKTTQAMGSRRGLWAFVRP